MYNKMVIAGNISSLGVICYIICQLWYIGTKIIQSLTLQEFKTSITTILRAFFCGVAVLVTNCRCSLVSGPPEDVEEGLQGPGGYCQGPKVHTGQDKVYNRTQGQEVV